MKQIGVTFARGVQDPKPLRGFPQGRARIRQRNDYFVSVFVRTAEGGIRKFLVREIDGAWEPYYEQGSNSGWREYASATAQNGLACV